MGSSMLKELFFNEKRRFRLNKAKGLAIISVKDVVRFIVWFMGGVGGWVVLQKPGFISLVFWRGNGKFSRGNICCTTLVQLSFLD